jgi:hypothetical protein
MALSSILGDLGGLAARDAATEAAQATARTLAREAAQETVELLVKKLATEQGQAMALASAKALASEAAASTVKAQAKSLLSSSARWIAAHPKTAMATLGAAGLATYCAATGKTLSEGLADVTAEAAKDIKIVTDVMTDTLGIPNPFDWIAWLIKYKTMIIIGILLYFLLQVM